jgi:hypothetical protein
MSGTGSDTLMWRKFNTSSTASTHTTRTRGPKRCRASCLRFDVSANCPRVSYIVSPRTSPPADGPASHPATSFPNPSNRPWLYLRVAARCAEPPLDLGPTEHLSAPNPRDWFGEPRLAMPPRPDRVRGDTQTPTDFGGVDQISHGHVSHDRRLDTNHRYLHRERARRDERGMVRRRVLLERDGGPRRDDTAGLNLGDRVLGL